MNNCHNPFPSKCSLQSDSSLRLSYNAKPDKISVKPKFTNVTLIITRFHTRILPKLVSFATSRRQKIEHVKKKMYLTFVNYTQLL